MSGHLVSVLLTLLKLSGFSYCPRTMVTESDTRAGLKVIQGQVVACFNCHPNHRFVYQENVVAHASIRACCSWVHTLGFVCCLLRPPPPPQLLQKIPTQYHLNSKFVFMVAVHKAGCAFERRTLHVSFYILHKRVSKTKAVKLWLEKSRFVSQCFLKCSTLLLMQMVWKERKE